MKRTTLTILLSGLLLLAPGNASAQTGKQDIDLYGSIIFASNWINDPNAPYGIYSFPAKEGTSFTPVKTGSELKANGAGVYVGGKYCMIGYTTGYYGEIDQIHYRIFDAEDGWKQIFDVPLPDMANVPTDLAYNPTNDKVYGCFWGNASDFTFGELNLLTGKPETIGTLPEQLMAVAINAQGRCYGIGASGMLYAIGIGQNQVTLTEIGQTGLSVRYAQSATFDFASGRLFWSATMYDTSLGSSLYEVNTTNGAVTLVSNYPENYEVTGLYTLSSPAKANAPGRTSGISFNYDRASLSGNISFTMPTYTAGGTRLEGSLTYSVNLDDNGNTLFTGSAAPGQTVVLPQTFAEPGRHLVRVLAKNSTGRGDISVATKWIGRDSAKPVNPVMTTTGTGLSVSWEAPTTGINGGYIDASKLSYRVTRQPEGEVVYTGTATSFRENLAVSEMGYYWYDVTALENGVEGETASSNRLTLGEACHIPYSQNFETAEALDWFTIINTDKDESAWALGEGCAFYTYDSEAPANDWLITPPLALDPEYAYQLNTTIYGGSPSRAEGIRIAAGHKAEAGAMNKEIGSVDAINWDLPRNQHFLIIPDTDEPTFIGLQATGKVSTSTLILDELSVTKVASIHAPASVTELEAIAGEQGEKKATLKFTLPLKSIDGKTAAGITKVEIYRNNSLLTTISSGLTDGGQKTAEDPYAPRGINLYRVTAYNAHGKGLSAETEVFVGEDVPGKVEDAKLEDLGNGTIKLSWKAPSKGANGGYVNPAGMTYDVSLYGTSMPQTVTETVLTASTSIESGTQKTIWYDITANSSMGSGETTSTNVLFMGDAFELPFRESFTRMEYQREPWSSVAKGDASWRMTSVTTAKPQDDDYGMILFSPMESGAEARLTSPKLSLAGSTNPTLTFWMWHHTEADNSLQVLLADKDGKEYLLTEIVQDELPEAGNNWEKYILTLDEYKALGDVQIVFRGMNRSYDILRINYLCIDNITLRSVLDYDLEATDLTGGAETKVGQEIKLKVSIENNGAHTAEGYTVNLYRNGKLVDTAEGKTLEQGRTFDMELSDTPNADASQTSVYYAVIDYSEDDNTDNNRTNDHSVNILPGLPFIDTLKGVTAEDNTTTLTWNAPLAAASKESNEVTDNFDSYAPFAISNVGQWSFIDGDGAETSGIIGPDGDYVQYPNVEKPKAFIVLNVEEAGLNPQVWGAHSGQQVMASFLSTSRVNDDWLISPELDGTAQTVKFWAKAPDCEWFETAETIQVLYSTTGTKASDFTQVGEDIVVNSEKWKELSAQLPAGAKYFAIRNVSTDQYILYIDDVTYRPAGNNLSLLGYNVYRNGEMLNAAPVSATTYTDKAPSGVFTYTVTAVYSEGESIHSNKYVNSTVGIQEGVTDGTVRIKPGKGRVTVNCADKHNVSVATVEGILVYSGKGNSTIALPAGIYVVTVGTVTEKVYVN